MKAYNDEPQLKIDMLAEVAKHRKADMLVKGTYSRETDGGKFQGCAVGCSLHSLNAIRGLHHKSGDHSAYETIGIPVALAYLQDGLFENLYDENAQAWPEQFWDAIPVGADLRFVHGKWFAWTLLDDRIGFWTIWKEKEDQDVFKVFGEFVAYLAEDKPFVKNEWDSVRKSYLASLDRLASLDSLARLASLDRLDSLASLARLDRLDRLDRLASLARLARLDRLDSLASLASLDSLARLASLDSLDIFKIAADKLLQLLKSAPIEKETT